MVFLHGQPGSARDWDAVVHLLALASPATVAVVPDRPGWGTSHMEAGGLYENATRIVSALDDADVEEAVVVGHSWGGGVALALAASHPDRVAGLVLAGSLNPTQPPGVLDVVFGYAFAGPLLAFVYEAVLRGLPRWPSVRRLLALRMPRPPDESLRRAFVRSYRAWLERGMWRSFVVEERRYRREQQRLRDDLRRVLAPTVVLVGDRDEFETVEAAQALADAVVDGVLETVSAAGHGIPWSRPGVFVRAIAEVCSAAGSCRDVTMG